MTDFLTDKNQTATEKGNNIINNTNNTNDTSDITKTIPELDRNILKKNKKNKAKKIRLKKIKISENDFYIPSFKEYENLHCFDYKIAFLKDICKHYKLKRTGNKEELTSRIYIFLYNSHNIIKIQNLWKKYILVKYNKLRGPALFNRNKCVNETDFYTLDDLKDIPYKQFYSFKDDNDQIFGFDIISIHNLLFKFNKKSTNPYNRQPFPKSLIDDIKRIKTISVIFNDKIEFIIEEPEEISIGKKLELRAVALFHDIDELGNYTDANWFNSLNRVALIRFIRELIDIWMYRAQLSITIKREICPPNGDPFRFFNVQFMNSSNFETLKENVLNIIEIFVKRGVNNESKILGSNYILCALTLVNNDAATSLPWLYQSVAAH